MEKNDISISELEEYFDGKSHRAGYKKCDKCGWEGYDAKWSICPTCQQTYYKCPNCGGGTKNLKYTYKYVYNK